jgi:DNA-binding transcriptional ArsR family regulator
MVYYSSAAPGAALDATFGALSDPTRRAILARLSQGESTVKALAAPFDMSLPAVSKHLRVLESAGLLKREVDGRVHRCRLAADPLKDAAAFIEHYRRFWEAQFDALQEFLETTDKEQNKWQGHNMVKKSRAKTKAASPSKSGVRSPSRAKGSSRPGPTASS